jgi:glyoxylate/hydroxypyruvate reductase A
MMDILFYAPQGFADDWLPEVHAAFPDARIRLWQDGDDAPADYAIVWKPPVAMLRGRRELKAIFNLGAGVDAILALGDALPPEVPVVRLDDAGMAIQMAEYVTHAVLRHFRRFDDYDRLARDRQWQELAPNERRDFPVGILGLGVLGTRVAQALAHFEFPVRGWSRSPRTLSGVDGYAGMPALDAFLRGSRVLVCALPLTTDTEGILCRANLEKLMPGAYLINIARGAHLVEQDLLDLLQSGHIAGATLDVCRTEPLPADHPFWSEPRITITPHISARTLRDETVRQISQKIAAMQRGDTVAGIVDRMKGY